VGKGLRVMMRLLKKLTSGCKYKIQTGNKRGSILRFLTGARLKVDGDFAEKFCV
jgi:hypothetical protein